MAPKSITLTYFNVRARGEAIRWILAQAGANYEDKRLPNEQWAEYKPKTPTGTLPVLTVDGVDIGQQGAIIQYLGAEFGLNGANNVEAALIHMIWNSLDEFMNMVYDTITVTDAEAKEKAVKKLEEKGPIFMKLLRNMLDGKEWLVGNKVSVADIAVACRLTDIKQAIEKTYLEAAPEVTALMQRVAELPKIKKWIEIRPVTHY